MVGVFVVMYFPLWNAVFVCIEYHVSGYGVCSMYIVRNLYIVEGVFNFLCELGPVYLIISEGCALLVQFEVCCCVNRVYDLNVI